MKCKEIFIIFIMLTSLGCSHFFLKNAERDTVSIEFSGSEYCLQKEIALDRKVKVDLSDERYGKVHNLISENYKSMKVNCESPDSLYISFFEDEERIWGDFYLITLGLIPGAFEKKWTISFKYKDKTYYSKVEGTNYISIFLTPFYPFNKRSYDIVFFEIDRFLKTQSGYIFDKI